MSHPEHRIEEYTRAMNSQSYITLLKDSVPFDRVFDDTVLPEAFDVEVLIEAANYPARNYSSLYKPIAFVLHAWRTPDGPVNLAINSEMIDFKTHDADMGELAIAAAFLVKVGQGYFNDPYAS